MKHSARRRAAALEYRRGQAGAPTLVAKGNDDVADEILAVAREHGVPIHHDPALVNVLSRLELDDEIPRQMFVAVATMLASILHAQCLLACSLQTPAPVSAVLNLHSGEHSCCPHQSDSKSRSSEKPCRTDSSEINTAVNEASVATNIVLPVVLLAQPGGDLLPAPSCQPRARVKHSPDSSTRSLLSSVFILRI